MQHDESYKQLFSHPEMVEDLLRRFVSESWIEEIDFKTLTRYDASFHSEDLQRREGDAVYKVNLKSGKSMYFYLFLEFQSRPEKFMAIRMLSYVALFYDKLLRTEGKNFEEGDLPLVWPVVVYNDRKPWPYVKDVRSCLNIPDFLLNNPSDALWNCIPQMHFNLMAFVDLFDPSNPLFDKVIDCIAALEVTADKKTAWQAANQLLEWLGKSNNERMARDVGKWFNKVFKPAKGRKLKDQQIMELPIGEVANMLESNIEHWEADILEEGLQRGLQRGREEGLRAAVRLALGFKFGDLGERFWLEHLEPQERDDWEAVFQAINSAPHLDALYPLHKT